MKMAWIGAAILACGGIAVVVTGGDDGKALRNQIHASVEELLLMELGIQVIVSNPSKGAPEGMWCYTPWNLLEGSEAPLDRATLDFYRLIGFDEHVFSDDQAKAVLAALSAKKAGDKIALKWREGTTELILKNLYPKAILGILVECGGIDPQMAQAFKIPEGKKGDYQVYQFRGAKLTFLKNGGKPRPSLFADAGLVDHDILVSVDGQYLDECSLRELAEILRRAGRSKDAVKIGFLRGSKMLEATLKLNGE